VLFSIIFLFIYALMFYSMDYLQGKGRRQNPTDFNRY